MEKMATVVPEMNNCRIPRVSSASATVGQTILEFRCLAGMKGCQLVMMMVMS